MAETTIRDISQTTFYREINKVINGDESGRCTNKWSANLFANNKQAKVYYLSGINNIRDYVNQYTDAICIDLVLSGQEYEHLVVPNRHKLSIRLFKEKQAMFSGKTSDESIVSQEFVAMLYDNSSGIVEGNALDIVTGDGASLVTVRFFLINKTIENLRLKTYGTTIRETIAAEAIRGILHQETVKSAEVTSEIYNGLELAPGYNTVIKKQIPIDHGTDLIGENSLIREVEEQSGGIYNAGFNYYYQQGFWYLYPPFDTARTDLNGNKTLTVITVPQHRFPGIETTYRTTPTQVIVLSTGAAMHQDSSNTAQKNEGNAVMYVDSNKIYNDFYKMEGDKLIVDSKKNVNNFGLTETERATNSSEVAVKNKGVTSKYFKEFSKLSLKLGMVVGCKWENGDPDLIYPGMPVTYMYLDNDQARQVNGTVIGVSIIVSSQGQGAADHKDNRKFNTSILLTLYIANKIEVTAK